MTECAQLLTPQEAANKLRCSLKTLRAYGAQMTVLWVFCDPEHGHSAEEVLAFSRQPVGQQEAALELLTTV